MDIKAKWIWKKQDNYNLYNQTVIFRKSFEINFPLKSAELAITADSFYRLYVNGSRINDGPSRAYPENYNYDLIDISDRLQSGVNEIYVIVRYFGCATFHQICQQAGFLAQLELEFCNGEKELIMSDSGWEVAEAAQWIRNMPRIYCQMEAVEGYDAQFEDNIKFEPAAELFSSDAALWRGLMARDCPLLTGKEFYLKRFHSAKLVDCKGFSLEIPLPRLCYPGVMDMNANTSSAGGIALIVEAETDGELEIRGPHAEITVNGRKAENNKFKVFRGRNFLLALNKAMFSHIQQMTVFFAEKDGIKIYSPLDRNIAYPCFLRFPELLGIKSDTVVRRDNQELLALQDRIDAFYADILNRVKSETDFGKYLKKYAEKIPEDCVLPTDFYPVFLELKTGMDAACFIESPEKLIFDDPSCTVIHPVPEGDIQVIYDLGTQNIGYYDFELFAGEGTVLDIFEVEHIFSDGRLQDTGLYQNGMRYICKAGHNKFTSLKRRSGRYLIIVFRKLRGELKFRNFKLIESTYPAEYKGSFLCSDEFMNRLWKISAHTLKLCMEDTFTDCPLYEQTLWVGDARNEALFAYPVFGAWDLSRRCIRIAAESLAHLPLVASQAPSCWDILIPVWSFLWEISVWEYYFETGDKTFMEEMWGAMVENLAEAERRIDPRSGLFSSPTWNLFDWSGTDIAHKTVIHDTMFFIGALQAAAKCAEALGKNDLKQHWLELENRLRVSVNAYYEPEAGAWPDSLKEDGSPVASQSIHNNFLSLLYDVAAGDMREKIQKILLDPPASMVKVGSPFAMQYLYETFEKLEMPEQIISKFYSAYRPMFAEDATTVWEVFPNSLPGIELSRSHCHGWSSSPTYFLNRIVLGIKMTEAGAKAFEISPDVNGFEWARGSRATVLGEVRVAWKKDGKKLRIKASAPEGVKLLYKANPSHREFEVSFN